MPTPWHADVFAASGLARAKLRVVGEAVDASLWDPSAVAAAERRLWRRRLSQQLRAPHPTHDHDDDRAAAADDDDVARRPGDEGEGSHHLDGGAPRDDDGLVVFGAVFKWEWRKGWVVVRALARSAARGLDPRTMVTLAWSVQRAHTPLHEPDTTPRGTRRPTRPAVVGRATPVGVGSARPTPAVRGHTQRDTRT